MAYERAQAAKGRSENATAMIEELLDTIDKFLEGGGAKPAEIREAADEVNLLFYMFIHHIYFSTLSNIRNFNNIPIYCPYILLSIFV